MRTLLLSIAALVCLPPTLSAVAPAEDDCDFDQQQRVSNMLSLEKDYPGSRYDAEEYTLIIPRGKDMVRLAIGGCVHYGVYIELWTPDINAYADEESLMAAILALVREYSQGEIDHEKLGALIEAKKWDRSKDGSYWLRLGTVDVTEVYRHRENDGLVIGISSYI